MGGGDFGGGRSSFLGGLRIVEWDSFFGEGLGLAALARDNRL